MIHLSSISASNLSISALVKTLPLNITDEILSILFILFRGFLSNSTRSGNFPDSTVPNSFSVLKNLYLSKMVRRTLAQKIFVRQLMPPDLIQDIQCPVGERVRQKGYSILMLHQQLQSWFLRYFYQGGLYLL